MLAKNLEKSDRDPRFKFFKDILPVITKSIGKGEPAPAKEIIVPPFLSIAMISNLLSLIKGVDIAAVDKGKKAFSKLSNVSLGDIRTRKELVDIRLFFLKLFWQARKQTLMIFQSQEELGRVTPSNLERDSWHAPYLPKF